MSHALFDNYDRTMNIQCSIRVMALAMLYTVMRTKLTRMINCNLQQMYSSPEQERFRRQGMNTLVATSLLTPDYQHVYHETISH